MYPKIEIGLFDYAAFLGLLSITICVVLVSKFPLNKAWANL